MGYCPKEKVTSNISQVKAIKIGKKTGDTSVTP